MNEKSEIRLACNLVRLLDGVSIEAAQRTLARAQILLLHTQLVNADSPLLIATLER